MSWRLALAALPLVALGIGVDAYRQRRRPLVTPNHAGQLPVPRAMIDSGELAGAMVHALQAYHQTQALTAAQPHIDKLNITVKEAPALEATPQRLPTADATLVAAPDMPALPIAPTFAQLVAGGFHARTDRMLLGYGTDGPIYGGIDALLSTAIAGRPGQGKSTTLRMVYAQCLQVGAEVMLLDPHGSIAGDVQQGPSQLVASTGAELDDAAAWLTSELERRLVAYRAGERVFRPLLVMADEMPVVALSSKPAVQALGRVVLEARKVGGYALISGQGLPASNFGGRLVRDALSSRIIHKTTAAEGLRAGLDKNAAQLLEQLQPGYAVLDGPVQPQIVAIPMTTANDLSAILYHTALQPEPMPSNVVAFAPKRVSIALECPTLETEAQPETLRGTGTTGPENGTQSVTVATPETAQALTLEAVPEIERAQIVALAKAGVSRRKIGEIVYGAIGGQAYGKVKQTLDAAGL
ncbi:MAG: hypothetical protein CYG59_11655 [Chloroflexi bacterium]|nr:MAG: hypothetical protein CYG59_11655 [Chloroflexota bacterium]